MDDLNRKIEDTMHKAGQKVREVADGINRSISQAGPQLQADSEEFIRYLNDDVVPAVRARSAEVLRIAAEKLQQLAASFEKK